MKSKSAAVIISILVTVVAGACLQGCSNTPASINRALVIGITTNQDNDNSALPNAATDMETFGNALPCNTKHLRIVTGDDQQPTRTQLLDELRQFAERTHQNDVAWLMIEGDGAETNGEGYFYTADSEQAAGSPARQTGIGMQDILQALKGMQAKELIITLAQNNISPGGHIPDNPYVSTTCLSGSQWNINWKIPPKVHSVVAFNCSDSGQSTVDGPVINTPYFTYFIEKGLEGGAADHGGEVKLRNLIRYVQLGVASNIMLYGGNVETCTWSAASQNKSEALDIVLAKNLPPGLGGESSVPLPSISNDDQRFEAAMLRAFELKTEIIQRPEKSAQIVAAIKKHTLLQLLRTNFAPVKKQFLEALLFNPNSPRAHYELAVLDMEMRDFKGAQVHLETAMKFSPLSSLPVWRLAKLMQYEKNYQKAENLYEKAIQIAPENVSIKYDFSTLYGDTHQYDKAKKLLQEIIQKNPTWSDPIDALSSIYYASGDKATGMRLLQQAYKLDPNNTDVVDRLAWVYYHQFKNYQKSEQLYRELVKLSPESGSYRVDLAECLLQEGKTDEAKSQAKTAIALGYPSKYPVFKKLHIDNTPAKQ